MSKILKEEEKIDKINEGDIIEGIFAIGVALYIAYDKIDTSMLANYQKQILPLIYRKEQQIIQIFPPSDKSVNVGPDLDRLKVELRIRLKSPITVNKAFGDNMTNIPNIQKKVAILVNQIDNLNALEKVKEFKKRIIGDGKTQIVKFVVICDGLAGETSKGKIKGDVQLNIQASSNIDPKTKEIEANIENSQLNFSLKSNSVTISNLSPYRGMKEIAEWFGIPNFPSSKYDIFNKPATTPEAKQMKYDLAGEIMLDFAKELEKRDQGTKKDFTKRAFEFLEKSAFGEDKADIIDITPGAVKEITQANIDILKNSGMIIDVKPRSSGNTVYLDFVREPTKQNPNSDKLFHLRIKRRESGEIKAYVEVGHLAYVNKKQEMKENIDNNDIVPIVIDFKEIRSDKLNESWLRMFGSWVETIMGRMFGMNSVPISIKGTKSEIENFANVLNKEKRYLNSYNKYELNNPQIYKDKAKLDNAIKGFEQSTGVKWPFKE